MVLTYQKWYKLMEPFFEHPYEHFTIQQLAKTTGIPPMSVQRYLKQLKEEGYILASNTAHITEAYKFKKMLFMVENIRNSGLLEYINKELTPTAIVLFGSMQKGEYDHESDIDLCVISTKQKQLNLEKFEKKLKHPIQLFVYKGVQAIPKSLYNNILNGFKLRGYLKIK